MAIIQRHDGGSAPFLWAQTSQNPQGLPKCDQERTPVIHNTEPYKHIRKVVGYDPVTGECNCEDCEKLAVDDVVTLGEVPAGTTLKDVQWNVKQSDPTFVFDLEVRATADLATAGTVVKAGLGGSVEDGSVDVNVYRSRYGVKDCPGKDCYGTAIKSNGLDHGMLVMVVKAVPTGAPSSCGATKCAEFGLLKMDLDYVVTDLR